MLRIDYTAHVTVHLWAMKPKGDGITLVDPTDPDNSDIVFVVAGYPVYDIGGASTTIVSRDLTSGTIYSYGGKLVDAWLLRHDVDLPPSIKSGFQEHGPNVEFDVAVRKESVR